MELPAQYAWLDQEPGPRMLVEAMKLYGTYEVVGPKHSPVIMGWAKELGLKDYVNDEIAWCGLFQAIVAHRAGWPVVDRPLWAANWLNWGKKVDGEPMLGDVLVFIRPGGNHVGQYVGEDADCYHVLGGNQKNGVTITRIKKSRLRGFRRAPWKQVQPANVRRVHLAPSGRVSMNEA